MEELQTLLPAKALYWAWSFLFCSNKETILGPKKRALFLRSASRLSSSFCEKWWIGQRILPSCETSTGCSGMGEAFQMSVLSLFLLWYLNFSLFQFVFLPLYFAFFFLSFQVVETSCLYDFQENGTREEFGLAALGIEQARLAGELFKKVNSHIICIF